MAHTPQATPWLHHPLATQLPGPYCLITCTGPEALRPLWRSPPRLAHQPLFTASSQALKRLANAPRCSGPPLPGCPGLLHPWGRPLPSHPPMPSLVPGGGLAQERDAWWPARANFYGPVRALAPISRALFTQEMRPAGPLAQIAPPVWSPPGNVHSQATPHGATSCTSLAPDVCTVASANRRLVGRQDRLVTFPSRTPGSPRPRPTRLDGLACRRRFRQHVLPAGGMKGRHCGVMHANGRINTATIRPLSTAPTGATLAPPRCPTTTPAQVPCPTWGAPLIGLSRVWPLPMALGDTGEEHGLDTSLTLSMLLWKEPGDGPSASSARDHALQGHFGQAAHGAPSPLWGLKILPIGCHPGPIIPPLASRTTLPLPPYPLDPEAAMRGFLEQGIEVTSSGHLNP